MDRHQPTQTHRHAERVVDDLAAVSRRDRDRSRVVAPYAVRDAVTAPHVPVGEASELDPAVAWDVWDYWTLGDERYTRQC